MMRFPITDSELVSLHFGKHNDEVQLYAFDVLALDGDDLRRLPLSMRKTNLARLLTRRRRHLRRTVRAGRDQPVSRRLRHGTGGTRLEAPRPAISGRQVEVLGEGEEPEASGNEPGDGDFRIAPIRNGAGNGAVFAFVAGIDQSTYLVNETG